MAGMIDQLIEILDEQTERYKEILGLANEKRDVIIANDIDELQKITHLENLVISQTQKLERKRMSLVTDMAIALGQKDELTLANIIELMDGQGEQQSLKEARDRIKAVLDELSEVNNQNGILIQNALEYIEYTTNLMQSSAGLRQPAYYSAAGEVYFDEPGFIDTKN